MERSSVRTRSKVISVSLPLSLVAQVYDEAQARRITVSRYVGTVLAEALGISPDVLPPRGHPRWNPEAPVDKLRKELGENAPSRKYLLDLYPNLAGR